jgi:hypothetical protein
VWKQTLIYSEFIQTFQPHVSKNDRKFQPCSSWSRQGGCELQLTYLEIFNRILFVECHDIVLQILLLKPLYSIYFYSSAEIYFPRCVLFIGHILVKHIYPLVISMMKISMYVYWEILAQDVLILYRLFSSYTVSLRNICV